jgi:hypothetical protein
LRAREALIAYLVEQEVLGPEDPADAWFEDGWYRFPVGERRVPVLPLFGLRPSLTLHDLNHLLSGYDLSPRGELQNAAWELGSGGCSRHWFWWVDRTALALIGLIAMPRLTVAAYREGRGQRNLYAMDPDEALEADIEALRRWSLGSG